MLLEFKIPEIGENIETADIIKIHVKPGDKVKVDQVVVELETDKANVEVPSEMEGTVLEVLAREGTTAKVGQVLFTMEAGEKQVTTAAPEKPADKKVDETKPVPEKVKIEPPSPKVKTTAEIRLPELGENITSADIIKVLVKSGDKITVGQTLIEIETDKAAVEVPSEVEGVIKKVNVKDGDKIKVGDVILIYEGYAAKTEETRKIEAVKNKKVDADPTPLKSEREVTIPKEVKPTPRRADMPAKIVPAAPSVRRFAREIGVNIQMAKGSGPGGRISIEDVKSYAKNMNEKISSSAASGLPIGLSMMPLPDFTKWGEVKVEQMNNVRKKTAEHLSRAWVTIPHVTQFDKADITELEKTRKQYAKKAEAAGGKLTVTAILLKITASALKVFPQFNSSIDMEKKEIIFKRYINIGVAVDTDRGLLVPVIQNVDKKNIIELASELADLSKKARDKKLSLDEMQGGNFSISNLGGIGGTAFTPIVNSPEVAILGVSRGSYEQVYKNGEFEPRLMLPLSLSYDHRIIDGADGARFVRWVAEALENPLLISLEG